MLVKFDSDCGSVTLFGDVAIKLLQMMGHSGTVPSAILAADIPAALSRLKTAVGSDPDPAPRPSDASEDANEGPRVSLRQRAHPLIELLSRAAARGCDVTWK